MIEKLKGKKELSHYSQARQDETSEQRAVRRNGQTDLQNDMEDQEIAANEALGIKPVEATKPPQLDTATGKLEVTEAPKQYRPVTVTREFNRPGDIATADARLKTVGDGGTTGKGSDGNKKANPSQQ